jgi:hypothetical protein
MKNPARALFGIALVAIGGLFLAEAADLIDDAGDILGRWWPVGLILVAVVAYLSSPRQWVGPVIIGAIGILLLLTTTDVVEGSVWQFFWPAIFIFLGASLLFRRSGRPRPESGPDSIEHFNAFSGSELASRSSRFEGGSIGVIFGGVELDLRDASPAPDARLDVFTMFGGSTIFVPDDWRVDVKGFPLFGGFENVTTRRRLPADAPALEIEATVLFGGLEVKY